MFAHCLVSEGVRLETGNKATILGYCGMSPNAELQLTDANQAIRELLFLFVTDTPVAPGVYKVDLDITDPHGKPIGRHMTQTFESTKPQPANLGFAVSPFPLTGPGRYRLAITVNGKPDRQHSFTVLQIP
jgi:hypothetical protein